jgi:hypothetical protein
MTGPPGEEPRKPPTNGRGALMSVKNRNN